MLESDYYPDGAYNDPNAPYNQYDPEPIEVDVLVSTTLSKSTKVAVDDYIAEEWEDCERDDDGYFVGTRGISYDFSNCSFRKAYKESNEFTITELLDEITKIAEEKLSYLAKCRELCKAKGIQIPTNVYRKQSYWTKIYNASINWTEDDLEVIKDD